MQHTVKNLPKMRRATVLTSGVVNSVLDIVRRDQDVPYDQAVNSSRQNELNVS